MKPTKRQKRQAAKNPKWLTTAAITISQKPRLKFSRGAASPIRHVVANGKPIPAPEPERLARMSGRRMFDRRFSGPQLDAHRPTKLWTRSSPIQGLSRQERCLKNAHSGRRKPAAITLPALKCLEPKETA